MLLKTQGMKFEAGPKSSPWAKSQHQIQAIPELLIFLPQNLMLSHKFNIHLVMTLEKTIKYLSSYLEPTICQVLWALTLDLTLILGSLPSRIIMILIYCALMIYLALGKISYILSKAVLFYPSYKWGNQC